MAAKRGRKTGRVSGISAAAIRGAKQGAKEKQGARGKTRPSDNAAKMARPGPGLADRGVSNRRSAESIESTTGQSARTPTGVPEEEVERLRAADEASPNDFDDFSGPGEP